MRILFVSLTFSQVYLFTKPSTKTKKKKIYICNSNWSQYYRLRHNIINNDKTHT